MDLSEQAVAALLAEEASRLRQAAGFQGYSAFLQKPSVRARPNKQFLAATVRNVESANRTAQVSEMWHLRQKELSEGEGSDGKAGRTGRTTRDGDRPKDLKHGAETSRLGPSVYPVLADRAATVERPSKSVTSSSFSKQGESRQEKGPAGVSARDSSDASSESSGDSHRGKREQKERLSDTRRQFSDGEAGPIGPAPPEGDDGEDEIDQFLHSRKKRGRGAIGSRMDEPGPFAAAADQEQLDARGPTSKAPVVLGPQLPADLEEQRRKKKRLKVVSSDGEETPRKRKKRDRTEEERRAKKEEKRKRKLEKERLREKRRQKRRSRDG